MTPLRLERREPARNRMRFYNIAVTRTLFNLRCVALNDEWEPFMNHHIQYETTRLYANISIQPPSTRLRLVA